MPSIRSRTAASALVALVVAFTGRAHAEPNASDKALADSLFQEGKRLMTAKRYAEACAKLAESQRLDPATGTLLNLAVCHELEGKTATAWVEFSDALVEAKRDKKPERVKLAQEHIAKLEPKLPRLTVTVAPDAKTPGLSVARNGVAINDVAWGVAVPIDPGVQTITATAPGKKPWESRVTLADGDTRTVTVTKLDAEAAPKPASTEAPPAAEASPPDARGRRTTAYVVGGVGVALVAVGGYFGLKTLSQKRDSDAHCPADVCDARGVSASDDARRSANFANVGVGLGLGALGVSAYLLFSTGSAPASAREKKLTVTPTASRDRAALTLGAAF